MVLVESKSLFESPDMEQLSNQVENSLALGTPELVSIKENFEKASTPHPFMDTPPNAEDMDSDRLVIQGELCFDYQNKGCCQRPNCKYFHIQPDKTICLDIKLYGQCSRGKKCRFAHEFGPGIYDFDDDSFAVRQRTKLADKPGKHCFNFTKNGSCPRGDQCPYPHVTKKEESASNTVAQLNNMMSLMQKQYMQMMSLNSLNAMSYNPMMMMQPNMMMPNAVPQDQSQYPAMAMPMMNSYPGQMMPMNHAFVQNGQQVPAQVFPTFDPYIQQQIPVQQNNTTATQNPMNAQSLQYTQGAQPYPFQPVTETTNELTESQIAYQLPVGYQQQPDAYSQLNHESSFASSEATSWNYSLPHFE